MKLVAASILVFSLVILFLFALFPADISVNRVIQINRPAAEVLKKIDDLREWKNWNLMLHNPSAGGMGNSQTDMTDSDFLNMGGISVQIVKCERDTVITRWQRGNKFFTGNFNLAELNGQTMVEWTFRFHIRWYPWEKLASMYYERQLGPLMEKSLLNLRNELEKK